MMKNGKRNQFGIQFLRPLPTAKLFDAILPAADAFLQHRWIQLEGVPSHSHFGLSIQSGSRLLQPTLFDETPRTDDIGNHVDGETHGNSVLMDWLFKVTPLITSWRSNVGLGQ